ncbi:MAG: hypothetical protein IKA99_01640 [Clostridia bacterium]|nr:hypothetical protein [Clostridia bacterium]
MSFFTNGPSDRVPGRINGNPVNGLCEKVCIQAQKVFDACIRQMQVDGVNLVLTDITPANPALPLTFVSARSTTSTGTVTNLQVDRLPDRRCFARVQATVTVPVEVLYTDANGVAGTATSTVSFNQDIIMYVPEPSIIPFDVIAVASVVVPDGVYVDGDVPSFNVSCCVTLIMKVVMTVELLVPSYGYPIIPQCQEYAQAACAGFFDLPIYPNNG